MICQATEAAVLNQHCTLLRGSSDGDRRRREGMRFRVRAAAGPCSAGRPMDPTPAARAVRRSPCDLDHDRPSSNISVWLGFLAPTRVLRLQPCVIIGAPCPCVRFTSQEMVVLLEELPVSGATAATRAGESKLLVVASFYPSPGERASAYCNGLKANHGHSHRDGSR